MTPSEKIFRKRLLAKIHTHPHYKSIKDDEYLLDELLEDLEAKIYELKELL